MNRGAYSPARTAVWRGAVLSFAPVEQRLATRDPLRRCSHAARIRSSAPITPPPCPNRRQPGAVGPNPPLKPNEVMPWSH